MTRWLKSTEMRCRAQFYNTPTDWTSVSFKEYWGTVTLEKTTDKPMPPYFPVPAIGAAFRSLPWIITPHTKNILEKCIYKMYHISTVFQGYMPQFFGGWDCNSLRHFFCIKKGPFIIAQIIWQIVDISQLLWKESPWDISNNVWINTWSKNMFLINHKI